jgi:DNA-binding NarL/FixJ family response regulator
MERNKLAAQWTPRLGAALTARELEVLELLADGCRDREIALALGVGLGVIALHRDHLCTKIGVRNRVELTRFAIAHGYVQTAWEPKLITCRNTSIVNDDPMQ